MKLKKQHSNFIARKITKDLINTDFIEVRKDKAAIEQECEIILNEDIQKEINLDIAVDELLDENQAAMDDYRVDERQLFWMTKKRLANEYGVNLNMEDRFSNIENWYVYTRKIWDVFISDKDE